eukprot:120565-Pelagomonas_calceolata.AAC.4
MQSLPAHHAAQRCRLPLKSSAAVPTALPQPITLSNAPQCALHRPLCRIAGCNARMSVLQKGPLPQCLPPRCIVSAAVHIYCTVQLAAVPSMLHHPMCCSAHCTVSAAVHIYCTLQLAAVPSTLHHPMCCSAQCTVFAAVPSTSQCHNPVARFQLTHVHQWDSPKARLQQGDNTLEVPTHAPATS